jgi:hypothetical protein
MKPQYIFPIIALFVFAAVGWGYIRHGSLVGALLGGRVTETLGEIALSTTGVSSRVLRVGTLEVAGGLPRDVALSIVSKAPFGASVIPLKLSRTQARELVALLQRATTD